MSGGWDQAGDRKVVSPLFLSHCGIPEVAKISGSALGCSGIIRFRMFRCSLFCMWRLVCAQKISWSASLLTKGQAQAEMAFLGAQFSVQNPGQHYASLQRYSSCSNVIVSLSGHITPQTNVCAVHQLWKWDIPLRLSGTRAQHSSNVLWTRKVQLTEPTGEIVWKFRNSSALCISLWKFLPLGPQHMLEVSNHRFSDTELFVCMP